MKFITDCNGHIATLISNHNYKGHEIQRVKRLSIIYYMVDGTGYYLWLRDAKKAIDKNEV